MTNKYCAWTNFEGFDDPYRVREMAARRLHLELKYHFNRMFDNEQLGIENKKLHGLGEPIDSLLQIIEQAEKCIDILEQ